MHFASLCLRFYAWMLKLFRQCGIFLFLFFFLNIHSVTFIYYFIFWYGVWTSTRIYYVKDICPTLLNDDKTINICNVPVIYPDKKWKNLSLKLFCSFSHIYLLHLILHDRMLNQYVERFNLDIIWVAKTINNVLVSVVCTHCQNTLVRKKYKRRYKIVFIFFFLTLFTTAILLLQNSFWIPV